VPLCFHLL